MNALERLAARLLGAVNRMLRPAPPKAAPALAPRRHASMQSPWRIYRLYASPPLLLLRNDQDKVVELGVVAEDDGRYNYRLNVGGAVGGGYLSLQALLDDVAGIVTSDQIESDLRRLAPATRAPGVDLDRGAHLDVSMRLDD